MSKVLWWREGWIPVLDDFCDAEKIPEILLVLLKSSAADLTVEQVDAQVCVAVTDSCLSAPWTRKVFHI